MTLIIEAREFKAAVQRLGASLEQLPFAMSLAMNRAAEKTRSHLIGQTWPSHVKVRDRNFLKNALTLEGQRATKKKLSITIWDKVGRAHLSMHDTGGIKRAEAGRLAIPSANVSRGSGGVRMNQRPKNLRNAVVKGNLIFQAVGRGKGRRLKLMYKLAPSAKIKKDVPFRADFQRVMLSEMRREFPRALAYAMRTAR